MDITEFFSNTLNCVYGFLLLAGFIYSLFLIVAQGAGEVFGGLGIDLDLDFDADLDLDGGIPHHDAADLFNLSTIAIASGITAIGAFGIISRALDVSEAGSLGIALIGGLIVGGFAQAFFVYILAPTTQTTYAAEDLIGTSAEVITPIPENNLGQIALVASGARVTMGARTTDGAPVERGTTVKIEKVVGGVAYVLPELGHPWV